MRPTVSTAEVLKIVRENRGKHRAVFEAAVDGWYKQCQKELDAARTRVLKDKPRNLYVSLQAPRDHTRDYDRVIRMLELHQQASVGSVITLSEEDVAQYIQDDWAWKRQWITTSSSYAAGTVQEMYGEEGD